jgi:hypothetical protein
MSYERALNRAKSINAKTFLSIERLPHGLGFVASYANDQSLRCVGQTVIHHADGRYGIVLNQNGFVAAEMEARDLMYRAGVFPAGAPSQPEPSQPEPGQPPLTAQNALRMETVLRLHYPELDDVENLLASALCDLRHFADRHGLDFGAQDHTGFFQYIEQCSATMWMRSAEQR